jgi:hypothetical protein
MHARSNLDSQSDPQETRAVKVAWMMNNRMPLNPPQTPIVPQQPGYVSAGSTACLQSSAELNLGADARVQVGAGVARTR